MNIIDIGIQMFGQWQEQIFQNQENNKEREFLEWQTKYEAKETELRQRDEQIFAIEMKYLEIEMQRQLAILHANLAYRQSELQKSLDDFPLISRPEDIFDYHHGMDRQSEIGNYRHPLHIILSPPTHFFTNNTLFNNASSYIVDEVGKKIKRYFGNNVLFMGNAWKRSTTGESIFEGKTSALKLHRFLKEEAFLISELKMNQFKIDLNIYYWDAGGGECIDYTVLDKVDFKSLLIYYKEKNHHQEIRQEDVTDTLTALSNSITCILGTIIDMHMIFHYYSNEAIILNQIKELVEFLPNKKEISLQSLLIEWVKKSFTNIIDETNEDYSILHENNQIRSGFYNIQAYIQLSLQLSKLYIDLGDTNEGSIHLKRAIKIWCELHEISENVLYRKAKENQALNVFYMKQDSYFFYGLIGIKHVSSEEQLLLDYLIDFWLNEMERTHP